MSRPGGVVPGRSGPGSRCEVESGLCVSGAPASRATGEACATSSECAGECFPPTLVGPGSEDNGGIASACLSWGCDPEDASACGPSEACAPFVTLIPPAHFSVDYACLRECVIGAEPDDLAMGALGHGAGCAPGYACRMRPGGSAASDGVCEGATYGGQGLRNLGEPCSTSPGVASTCWSPYGRGVCTTLSRLFDALDGSAALASGTCEVVGCADAVDRSGSGGLGMPDDLCGPDHRCAFVSGESDLSFCARTCETGDDCATGLGCVGAGTTSPGVCIPRCTSDAECSAEERCVLDDRLRRSTCVPRGACDAALDGSAATLGTDGWRTLALDFDGARNVVPPIPPTTRCEAPGPFVRERVIAIVPETDGILRARGGPARVWRPGYYDAGDGAPTLAVLTDCALARSAFGCGFGWHEVPVRSGERVYLVVMEPATRDLSSISWRVSPYVEAGERCDARAALDACRVGTCTEWDAAGDARCGALLTCADPVDLLATGTVDGDGWICWSDGGPVAEADGMIVPGGGPAYRPPLFFRAPRDVRVVGLDVMASCAGTAAASSPDVREGEIAWLRIPDGYSHGPRAACPDDDLAVRLVPLRAEGETCDPVGATDACTGTLWCVESGGDVARCASVGATCERPLDLMPAQRILGDEHRFRVPGGRGPVAGEAGAWCSTTAACGPGQVCSGASLTTSGRCVVLTDCAVVGCEAGATCVTLDGGATACAPSGCRLPVVRIDAWQDGVLSVVADPAVGAELSAGVASVVYDDTCPACAGATPLRRLSRRVRAGEVVLLGAASGAELVARITTGRAEGETCDDLTPCDEGLECHASGVTSRCEPPMSCDTPSRVMPDLAAGPIDALLPRPNVTGAVLEAPPICGGSGPSALPGERRAVVLRMPRDGALIVEAESMSRALVVYLERDQSCAAGPVLCGVAPTGVVGPGVARASLVVALGQEIVVTTQAAPSASATAMAAAFPDVRLRARVVSVSMPGDPCDPSTATSTCLPGDICADLGSGGPRCVTPESSPMMPPPPGP